MDIKSMTELMQLTMLKKMTMDNSMNSLTGSSQNSEMFQMMLEVLIENAAKESGALQGQAGNGIEQLMSLQNSLIGNTFQQSYSANNSTTATQTEIIGSVDTGDNETSTQSNTIGASSRAEIEQAIQAAARKYGVDEDFIRAMVKQESGFRPGAVSRAGAMGLMQLMPKTADSLGVKNPFDVLENVDGGTKYIKRLIDSFDGNKELALSAYNGGIGRMNRRGVDTVEEIDNMPRETQNYVAKVMKTYESYKK